ncbi:9604_t:CDS:10 [Ambispora leptoticha]|uniref:Protein farnesyltransferase subunit beta n=1 Tax=Ambispora leptoticha TaxID=144679 RepID=A0A9N9B8D3_9GLOM|nr:9604_t:CDS:10 [Ambispora leptoticha]
MHRLETSFSYSDNHATDSYIAQSKTEHDIYVIYRRLNTTSNVGELKLEREKHIKFLERGLTRLSGGFVSLDASKPWIAYWILHSLDLLGTPMTEDLIKRGISTLSKYQNSTGGFGGGSDQISHVAVTYAAVNALAVLGTQEAYDIIDRENLYKWLLKLKQPDGSFVMSEGGEVDVRGAYCALSVAVLTNILTPELTAGTAEWIKKCQNFDGGIGGVPGIEAHGGYAFCALAAMEIMGKTDLLDIPRLLKWAVSLQMSLEGGFQGRPNKLVDGCYSFWVGGLFPLIEAILTRRQFERRNIAGEEDLAKFIAQPLFDQEALQVYILAACQSPGGGLMDKPYLNPDFYHTCYCLSGLSSSQHHIIYDLNGELLGNNDESTKKLSALEKSLLWVEEVLGENVVGLAENLLRPTHPIHNVSLNKARSIIKYFKEKEL